MKFKTEKIKNKWIGKWYIIIDNEEWIYYIKKAEKKALEQLEIPGFRKGKVPIKLIEKKITETKILNIANKLVFNKAYKFAFDQKSDIKPFSTPIPSIKKICKTEYILQLKFDLKPEIKINKYIGFVDEKLKKTKIKVKKENIDENINKLLNCFKTFIKKTTEITIGDIVILDFEGFINGKPFKGNKKTNFTLEIGSNKFIHEFENALIGLKAGDKKEINITFPENYHIKKLKKTEVIFKINIKNVKIKKIPELNNEFIKNINLKNINTLIKFKKYIKNNIYEQLLKKEYNKFINNLFRLIAKDSKIIFPESIINKEINKLKNIFEQKLKDKQINIKTYKKQTGITEKDIFNELFKDAKNYLEDNAIINTVIKNENITANKIEINKQYKKIKEQIEINNKIFKKTEYISKEQIKEQIINFKVFSFLYQNNGTNI